MTKLILRGPDSLRITLDRSKVNNEDPGADTPALVYSGCSRFSATYWAALGEEELTNDDWEVKPLSPRQVRWIREQEGVVADFLYDGPRGA